MTNDDNAPLFKYKGSGIGDTANNWTENGVKLAVLLKYLNNFLRSLEIPLINYKVELSLKWIENCVLTTAVNASNAIFEITDAKLYVPVVTLSAEDNVKLVKQLNEWFKKPVYWNKYKVIDNKVVEIAAANAEKQKREWLDSSYQWLKRLFVLAYDNTASNGQVSVDSFKKYFLQRVKIENYRVKIDGRNFYDQSVND